MAWQSMAPLGIISAMFFVTANGISVINWLDNGKIRRKGGASFFDKYIDQREEFLREWQRKAKLNDK